jgi:hypothetical protein
MLHQTFSENKSTMFPSLIRKFTNHMFKDEFLNLIIPILKVDKVAFIRKLGFYLGSFILPKYMIKSFTEDPNTIDSTLLHDEEKQIPDHNYDFFGYLENDTLEMKKDKVL